ncbi:MAG: hypothetical protein R3C14_23245 [Caldilineaceae bacterium]
MSQKLQNKVAVVIGGSMAGLLTARILSNHFTGVILLERDKIQNEPVARKGQPQTRHLHGLLAKGLDTMQRYFPTLVADLKDGGASVTDLGQAMRWYAFGGYRHQFPSGMIGALMSRPFLEWQIRRQVMDLPNVQVFDEYDVEGLMLSMDRSRVTGVTVQRRNGDQHAMTLMADLVVDASGRGSASPKWLAQAGYAKPAESFVKANLAYATRTYRRQPGDLIGAELLMIAAEPPHGKRLGLLFPIEGDRWICTLCGWAGDHPPTDEAGFMAFAQSLPVPDLHIMLQRLEPLSDIIPHKFPGSLRRHYEGLKRFPEGYLVLGDALCSFNPVYGQGMTSAALQAAALDRLLTDRTTLTGLWRDFFKAAAQVVAIPWQLAVGEDFRYPETAGKKPAGVDLLNAYVAKVHQATHHDPTVYLAFLKVMNLMAAPTSLFHPRILWRVLRGKPHAQMVTPLPEPEMAYR